MSDSQSCRSACGVHRASTWQTKRKTSEPAISISRDDSDISNEQIITGSTNIQQRFWTDKNGEEDCVMYLSPPKRYRGYRRSSSVVVPPSLTFLTVEQPRLERSSSMSMRLKSPSRTPLNLSPTDVSEVGFISSSIIKRKNPLLAKVESNKKGTSRSGSGPGLGSAGDWKGLKKLFSKSFEEVEQEEDVGFCQYIIIKALLCGIKKALY
jgi:hypothetical protein